MRILLKTGVDAADIFNFFRAEPEAVFFDSAMKHDIQGRYSIIMFRPVARVLLTEDKLNYEVFDKNMIYTRRHEAVCKYLRDEEAYLVKNPIALLSRIESLWQLRNRFGTLPCEYGAMAGYISYDYARRIEKLPQIARDDTNTPLFIFGVYDFSLVTDHHNGALYFCYPDNRSAIEYHDVLNEIKVRLKRHEGRGGVVENKSFSCTRPMSDFNEACYMDMVRRAQDYIRDGDIFQVNLSQRFSATYQGDPYLMYLRLRQNCPASFYAYLAFDVISIASASPERFFEIDKGKIITRPIKGTRPSGRDYEENQLLEADLISSEKDQAELMMIVDLLRNDLGKICNYGTVEVLRLYEVERYANVLHMVSTIQGEMAPDIAISDVLTALFPGGSITGAPKIRAMEIIDENEPIRRGVYTGAIGYIGFDGRSDFNIAIRTLVCMGRKIYYHVGGGIVWDSDPKAEYLETLDKGRSIADVLGMFEE